MEFNDFDVEIENKKDSTPEHIEGSVTTAGVPITVTASNAKPIHSAIILNQRVGPNANPSGSTSYLRVSTDGGSNWATVPRNGWITLAGVFDDIRVDAGADGLKYEIILLQTK